MVMMLLWPMLLIITPDAGGFGPNYHFYVYVIFVVIMYLTILAQFGTAPKGVIPLISKIWVGVYGGCGPSCCCSSASSASTGTTTRAAHRMT